MSSYLTRKKWIITNAALLALALAAMVCALGSGSESVGISKLFSGDVRERTILLASRLPRILLAALVGMALASSGGAFQALLRNPE